MLTKFVEVTNGPRNWGKFMVARFDRDEWQRRSALPEALGQPLLAGRGWTAAHLLVVDLQTGEGAMFMPGGSASADLDKHRVWVCPMFEPFLGWLYERAREVASHARGPRVTPDAFLARLPDRVDLPDAPFSMAGYRREGGPDAA